MGQILSLLAAPDESLLDFLVVRSHQTEIAEQISPHWMAIAQDIVLIDLFAVRSYWQQQAQRLGVSPTQLWTQLYTDQSVLAVQAAHPFQGLILCEFLRQRGVSPGFFSLHSPLLAENYRHMDWSIWQMSVHLLHQFLAQQSGFTQPILSYKKEERRLFHLLKNLGVAHFSHIQAAHFWQIQRRFGVWMGKLWQWTFPQIEQVHNAGSLFAHFDRLKDFPWLPSQIPPPWHVRRELEWLIHDWDSLEPLLTQDFAKLHSSNQTTQPSILQLRWVLIWGEGERQELNLSLRHPLSLSEESQRGYPTLRKQFHLQFTAAQKLSEEEVGLFCVRWLQAYSIEVTQVAPTLVNQTLALSPELRLKESTSESVLALANRLQGELQSFSRQTIAIHLNDFHRSPDLITEATDIPQMEESRKIHDPFYLYPQAKPLPTKAIQNRYFLKRVSAPWWQREDCVDEERDCYFCQLQDGRLVFAYRDQLGAWFEYGY